MPELPEVETIRRVLQSRLAGLPLGGYRIPKTTFYRAPDIEGASPRGSILKAVKRRGKYLLLEFSKGKPLTLHLGMSGRLTLDGGGKHIRFELRVGGHVLAFNDPRRFGRVGCPLPHLGPEPLSADFTSESLGASLRGRRAPVKALLLDQRVVAGIGNIYATEALHAAGIRPDRRAGSLSGKEASLLCAAIKRVLKLAVRLRGSTLDDEAFLDPLGRSGDARKVLRIYGRKRCPCGQALLRTRRRLAGRTSLYCPDCQR